MYIIFRRKPMGFPHLHGMPWLFRHSAPRLPTAADKGLNLGVPTSSMQITLNILILIIYTWSYVIYILYIYIYYIYIFWLIYICSHMWHMWSYVYHVTWLPYEVMDQRGSFLRISCGLSLCLPIPTRPRPADQRLVNDQDFEGIAWISGRSWPVQWEDSTPRKYIKHC